MAIIHARQTGKTAGDGSEGSEIVAEPGDISVGIIELTDENRAAAFQIALSMYLGEACKYCGVPFETLDDLHTAVWAGYHERGRLAHKACWDANNT